jgi:hypothetical protein
MRHQDFLPGIWASPYHGNVPDHRTARSVPDSYPRPHRHITDKELRP